MRRRIPLTKGQFAIVDAADYRVLIQYKWQAKWCPKRQAYYATRAIYLGGCGKHRGSDGRWVKGPEPRGKQREVKMHEQILQPSPGFFIDHRDHNPLNNTRANLRIATRAQNARNKQKVKKTRFPYKGVTGFQYGKYSAGMRIDGRLRYLGAFETIEDAARAYDKAALEAWGEFAHINNV